MNEETFTLVNLQNPPNVDGDHQDEERGHHINKRSMLMNPLEVSPEYANHALIKFFVSQKTYGFPGSDGSVLSCIMWRILEEHDIICIFFAIQELVYLNL